MARPEKVQAVAEIKERLEGASAVFLAEYSGLSVKEQQELRRSLRAAAAEFKVVKMTLARRAAAELDINDLDELLLGPTGLAFADRDPVEAAKALKDFAASHEAFFVKGGLLGTDLLTPERVSALAEIEPREVLLAKLAGGFQAPMARLAGLVSALPRNMANALMQLRDKKEASEPQPAEAPAVAEETSEAAAVAETEEAATEAVAEDDVEAPVDEAVAAPEAEAPEAAEAPETAEAPEPAAETAAAPEAEAAEAVAEPETAAAADDDTTQEPEPEAAAAPEAAVAADEPADAEDTVEDSTEEDD